VSWYNFTRAIIESAANKFPLIVKTVTPVSTAEFPRPAKRPGYSVLATDRIKKEFAISSTPWQTGLDRLLDLLAAER
jgi:dTDP-4-dehydrorhamnose reductase